MEKTVSRAEVSGNVKAPSSKSYAQRAIAASLLAGGESALYNIELCSDTRAALLVAAALGADAKVAGGDTYLITGGLSPVTSTINIGESGLSARMFTPIASLCSTPVTITGSGSILRRPMGMMIEPLRNLGVEVRSESEYLPVTVRGPIRGGETVVDGSVSSQFLTGLLMALPLAKDDTTLTVSSLNSVPYIDMTIDVLEKYGIEIKHNGYTEFFIEGNQAYRPQQYNIEGDWSGASCLLVAGAVAGEVTVTNLNPLSKQADLAIIDALSRAGAGIVTTPDSVTVMRPEELRHFNFDATHCPDLFPALVALAANCSGVSAITGTRRLIHKESARAHALTKEYGKMGVVIDIPDDEDIMYITGGPVYGAKVDSHNDHRIAMSLAVAALNAEGATTISGTGAVDKSYPDFWNDLENIRR